MAYIVTRKNREGKTYVYLAESFRVNEKVSTRNLKAYGQLEKLEEKEPGALERLRAEAKAGIFFGTQKKDVSISHNLDTLISYTPKNYGWKILNDVYQELNITPVLKSIKRKSKYDLDEILKLLVFGRVLNPKSKSRTVKN